MQQPTQPKQWFLYVRKSTDEEDRQVLSLEAQLHELKEFAAREGLLIAETFSEKKTAKMPGRNVFNEMLEKIEAEDQPTGIVAWHADRLSRNSVDGGKIIYLLDTGKLSGLKFPTFAFENTPSGKFFLSIALSNAKYYVDNLSENVKRGYRAKLRRGEWPGGMKPFGYMYDTRARNITPEPGKSAIVKKAYEAYATGNYHLKSMGEYLYTLGAKTCSGRQFSFATVNTLLTNQIYMGIMKWNGEVYEGNYKPIVSRELFEKVQCVLKDRGRPRHIRVKHKFPFCGVFKCGCGGAITAQWTKKIYRYYRCTKKFGPCNQPYVQETELLKNITEKLQNIALPDTWATEMLTYLSQEEQKQTQSIKKFQKQLSEQIQNIDQKQDKLLTGYLDGLVEAEEYKNKKEDLLKQKIALKGQKTKGEQQTANRWIEPTKKFINTANQAKNIAAVESPEEISRFVGNIGTNRRLAGKNIEWDWLAPYDFLAEYLVEFRERGQTPAPTSGDKNDELTTWQARSESNRRRRFWRP